MGEGGTSTATSGRPIHCKAAVMWAPGEKYKMESVVVSPPRENQVRIKILYTAICHTDVTMAKMQAMASLFPVVLGHESAGIVEGVGEGVTNVQVGDHVLVFIQGHCGDCSFCKGDKTNVCKLRIIEYISPTLFEDDEPHFTTEDGKVLTRLFGLSTFSEYTVVHKTNVTKINPEAPLQEVCVLSCGVATGWGAAWKVAKVHTGSTVAVFGLGTIGLAALQACKLAGASRIIGVDINPDKAKQAKDLGMTDFLNPKDYDKPIPEVIKELTGGGVEFSFECVGLTSVMRDAVECTTMNIGMTVIIGLVANPTEQFEISAYSFVLGKTVCGTILGGVRLTDLSDMVERCMRKEYLLEPFLTHSLPFSQINEAMEVFNSGNCLRCVLRMGS